LKRYFILEQQRTFTNIAIFIPIIAYLLGESLHLSGIVAILFCGIGMSRYTLPNLSKNGKSVILYSFNHNLNKLTTQFYNVVGTILEHSVFLFIGIAVFSFSHPLKSQTFSLILRFIRQIGV